MPTVESCLRDLRMPDFRTHAITVVSPGAVDAEDTRDPRRVFARCQQRSTEDQHNFRVFGPDETVSNLFSAVFEVTDRQWDAREVKNDELLAPSGTRARFHAE